MTLFVSLLNGINFSVCKEKVAFFLGVMDFNLALLYKKSTALTEISSPADIFAHQSWEKSNMLSLQFIRSLPITTSAKAYMKIVEDRFQTVDKSLADKLMKHLTSIKHDGSRTMYKHVTDMHKH